MVGIGLGLEQIIVDLRSGLVGNANLDLWRIWKLRIAGMESGWELNPV